MSEDNWPERIRQKRRKMYLRAFAFLAFVELLFLGVCALGVWLWVAIFHQLPPGRLLLTWIVGIGTLIVVPLSAISPLAPMKGPDPEVLAADEFFKGPRV